MEDKTIELLATKVDTAIATLSSKIGVAADHFYPILVKQQILGGYISIGWASFAFLASLGCWYGAYKEDGDAAAWFTFLAIGAAGASVFLSYFGMLGVMNPEYYAIKEITTLIK